MIAFWYDWSKFTIYWFNLFRQILFAEIIHTQEKNCGKYFLFAVLYLVCNTHKSHCTGKPQHKWLYAHIQQLLDVLCIYVTRFYVLSYMCIAKCAKTQNKNERFCIQLYTEAQTMSHAPKVKRREWSIQCITIDTHPTERITWTRLFCILKALHSVALKSNFL